MTHGFWGMYRARFTSPSWFIFISISIFPLTDPKPPNSEKIFIITGWKSAIWKLQQLNHYILSFTAIRSTKWFWLISLLTNKTSKIQLSSFKQTSLLVVIMGCIKLGIFIRQLDWSNKKVVLFITGMSAKDETVDAIILSLRSGPQKSFIYHMHKVRKLCNSLKSGEY